MPQYIVNLSRYVEQVGAVVVTAADPSDAIYVARFKTDLDAVGWKDGDGTLSVTFKSAEPIPRDTKESVK